MKNICVYCGSSYGRQGAYSQAACDLAQSLVNRDLRLIYGGAAVGIMGLLAAKVLELGGEVEGVIPESLVKKEVAHDGLTKLHVTESMHERKKLMADLADGFIAMPGGLGTLEEIFEVWSWALLGYHRKPCGLLNVAEYFDLLSGFLDHTVEEEFIKAEHRTMIIIENDPETLLEQFESYKAPQTEKWIGRPKA